MSKTFASLNPNALGPGLALDLGNIGDRLGQLAADPGA
jgi:hypothetical protein